MFRARIKASTKYLFWVGWNLHLFAFVSTSCYAIYKYMFICKLISSDQTQPCGPVVCFGAFRDKLRYTKDASLICSAMCRFLGTTFGAVMISVLSLSGLKIIIQIVMRPNLSPPIINTNNSLFSFPYAGKYSPAHLNT